MNMMTDFMNPASPLLGVGMAAHYTVAPEVLAFRLLDTAKRHARFFEEIFPEIGHRKMLESIAVACKFPNWHAFQSLLKKVEEDFAPPKYGSRPQIDSEILKQFVPALPLLIHIQEGVAPEKDQREALEEFAGRFGKAIGNTSAVLDVLAKLNGSDTWKELLARSPLNSIHPLYTFVVDENRGVFEWSPACGALVEAMDHLWQHYSERTEAQQKKARQFITETVTKRPDFLEGYLALATIEELDGNELKAGPIFDRAIKAANALIPKGFKGEIAWGYMDNRFYLRLLFNYMRWLVRDGQIGKAITLAKRQLRLNPEDNCGVRMDLPLYLAASGQIDAAEKASGRLTKKGAWLDGHMLLILSLCKILSDDLESGIYYFLRALFELPVLRPIVEDEEIPDDFRDAEWKWHRGVIPDMESLWFHYQTAIAYGDEFGVDEAYELVLLRADVAIAEQEMAELHRKARSNEVGYRTDGLKRWRSVCEQTARALAARVCEDGLSD